MQLRRVRGPEIHPTVSAPPDDTVIDKLEYSDSIQQLLYNIEKVRLLKSFYCNVLLL